MRRAALGLAIGLIFLAGVLVLTGGPREGLRAVGDARALAALPRVPVAPMLALPEGAPDTIVFMDGDAGWFELDIDALPPDTEIGMHGPRFFDLFTGNTHLPLYCSGGTARPGKIIWMIRNAEIARNFAFCNRRRMDLGPLRPHTDPVTMVDATLTQAEVEALRARIASVQGLWAVTLPAAYRPFTHQRVIEAPFHWIIFGTGQSTLPLREDLSRAVTAHLGAMADQADITINERVVSFLTDTMGHGDRAATQAMGAGIAVDGGSVILPDMAISQFRVTLTCTPAACAALDGFDATPLLADFRDGAVLDLVLASALPIERNPDDLMPTPLVLRDPTTRLTATAPVTYAVRYIKRSPSD
ncbi:hypothetical protein KUL25_05900 [Rhodobacteraceae bacterium N5(2021)]|uniref:Uncharacterized protein n=1 Tax=Gymnodinialimonas phycosphaerae TaxID=2841589 RepID=A0A975YH52_9RHOB|nr:hypothetical protein [Gymnodinialimonas phycosphaerae]MBY4892295.1 hypothetical protein [Gymnodinialimonas phycosphaerae]